MTKRVRLGKARKRAKLAIRQTRKLLKKHGPRLDPAHVAEVTESLDALVAAQSAPEVVVIYDALKALDARVDERLGHLRKSTTREYIESIGVAVLIALLLRAFIIEAFTIPSGSMIPTLAVGDFLFVNKLSYGVRMPFVDRMVTQWSEPSRGDVVVFVYPCDPKLDYIKRVIGLPGDEVFVDPQGFVTLNGEAVEEVDRGRFGEYDHYRGSEPDTNNCGPDLALRAASFPDTNFQLLHCLGSDPIAPPIERARTWDPSSQYRACPPALESMHQPWKVPDGHVFVMGDNRRNSADSRFWGFVPYGSIKGKAMFIWLSWNGAKSFTRPWEKIRWGRMFRGVHRDPG
jgi:signal peptidase I